jgi:hypothetical protein
MMRVFIIILTTAFLSCNNSDNSKLNTIADAKTIQNSDTFPITELFVEKDTEDGGYADIRLSITKISKSDTAVTYFVNSLYDKKNIGFKITIPTALPKSEKQLAQILTLTSSGNISDNFIQTLSTLYKVKLDRTLHFVALKRIAFIDLNEFAKAKLGKDPSDKTAVKEMKVFFEAENPDDYAEIYINVNEAEHWIEIKEKDEGYRNPVIKGLTAK